jgi:peptide/nickel transport system ATP-binding protein
MKQRMVMVLSTLLNPSLLLADEITSALDVSSQKAVAEMLVEFRDREFVKSLIVITHDISILYQIADSIMIMYAGQLAERASTQTIIFAPRHPYTKMLISSLPKVGVRYADKRLSGIPGSPPLLLNPPLGCRFRERCPLAYEKCLEVPSFVEIEISKTYRVGTFGGKELHAVSNVSFDVIDREIVSLIGESGSGKSTIGKMILRLISTSSGEIDYNDINVSALKGGALKEYYRKVQGVFQDPFSSYNTIFKADRIFRNIREEFFPEMKGSEWNDKVNQSLTSVGLNPEHVLNKFPHQLSGGQLQRFLIARALLLDTQLLVADEIISMLDASTRIDVLNLLVDLQSRGLSVLFITHDLSLGYYISQRAVILYRGCVVEMGLTEKIYSNPRHPYTKMLMASVPRLDKKWDEANIINIEQKVNQFGATSGCIYCERCPVASKELGCDKFRPMLVELESDHFAACYRCKEA